MTKTEVTVILAMLAEMYPKEPIPDEPGARVAAWHEVLRPYDFDAARAAIVGLARQQASCPSVARIASYIGVLQHGEEPDEAEVWNWCTSSPTREELATAHPVIRYAVANTGGREALGWQEPAVAQRMVRSAYFTALERYRLGLALDPQKALPGPTAVPLKIFKTVDEALNEGGSDGL
jgi:hypothetical protein